MKYIYIYIYIYIYKLFARLRGAFQRQAVHVVLTAPPGAVLSILGGYPEQNYMLNTLGIMK